MWAEQPKKTFIVGDGTLGGVSINGLNTSSSVSVTVDGFQFTFTIPAQTIKITGPKLGYYELGSNSYKPTVHVISPYGTVMTRMVMEDRTTNPTIVTVWTGVDNTVSQRSQSLKITHITITYRDAVTSTPSFAQSEMMGIGRTTFQNEIQGLPADYDGNITYSSDNTGVATVNSSDGTVSPTGAKGTAVITAQLTETVLHKLTTTTISYTVNVPLGIDHIDRFLLTNADDWKTFANWVNNGNSAIRAALAADISLKVGDGSNLQINDLMVGTIDHKYSGTFDGEGYTLSIDWNVGSTSGVAPFGHLENAEIEDLHTKGQITSDGKNLSGLVYRVYGGFNFISGCVSEVDITSNYSNDGCGAAGMVCLIDPNADVGITDCVVRGTFNATTEEGRRGMCGFVYSQEGTCTIENCLYIGSNNGSGGSKTFAKKNHTTITNCYFLNPCGEAQGTQVTEKQLKNGYVTNLLQARRTDQGYWAQKLGEMPGPYNEINIWGNNYLRYETKNQRWECILFRGNNYVPVGIDFYANAAYIIRNFQKEKIYTLCLPFDWRKEASDIDKVYTLSSVNESEGIASFREVTNYDNGGFKYFPAYHPYLVVFKEDGSSYAWPDVSVKAEPETPVAEDVNGVKWCGTYEGLTNAEAAAAGAYILQSDGQFHKVTTENTNAVIPPYRAYLTIPNASPGKKRLSIAFDNDNTTSLRAIETTDADGTVRYYDLQGRYIGTTLDGQPEGIYVGGGKKVIKK